VKVLSTERLLSAAGTDAAEFIGGPALFERRVVPWFAALWAVLVIVSNYTGKADVRVQIVINLVGVFFAASCLMLRRYRLDPHEALALRAPRPMVWLGVLIAVPGGMLTALGLFRLTDLLLPVPQKVMESFGENVLPPGISLVQLLFFLCVLPGIFEEIAFRGLLLHGLRRRLRPAPLALVVGLTFGIFHVALFRFVPTACLGVMLAAVTLLTGSIYPAMVWHALSNAAGILAYKLQIPEAELDPICYFAGAGILAAAFWVFWRNRTPYPGLRYTQKTALIQNTNTGAGGGPPPPDHDTPTQPPVKWNG
jgi:membrane protease YdiL (CAAX protease family)